MAGPSASGTLDILALGAHVGFGVAMRGSRDLAEMPVHPLAPRRTGEQNGVTALRGAQGELVKVRILPQA